MDRVEYMPEEINDDLKDIPAPFIDNVRRISIGKCIIDFNSIDKTFSFLVHSDQEWPIKSAVLFARILEYIETTYGR